MSSGRAGRRRSVAGWATAVFVTAFVLALIAAPPFVGDGLRHVIMAGFAGICHQIPLRSPHVDGIQLAVCHRCLGIYAALAAAALVFPALVRFDAYVRRNAAILIAAAVLVPGIDWAAETAGLWTNTPASRLLTGAVFGSVAGYLLTGAVMGLFADGKEGTDIGGERPSHPIEQAPCEAGAGK